MTVESLDPAILATPPSSDGAVTEHQGSTKAKQVPSPDLLHFTAGIVALLLLEILIIWRSFDFQKGSAIAFIAFGIFGLGSAPLQKTRFSSGLRFVTLAIGIGIALVILIGFALLELHAWSAGTPVFVLLAIAASILHGQGIYQSMPNIHPFSPSIKQRLTRIQFWHIGVSSIAVLGAVLCLIAAIRERVPNPGPGDFVTSISSAWFFGLALIVLALFLAWRKAEQVIGLVVITWGSVLVGTSAIVYPIAEPGWAQRHIGVTSYFIVHGTTNGHVDIYQSWPGLFAGIAWLYHVAGGTYLEGLARYWPLFVTIAGMVVVRYLGSVIGLDRRGAWLAAALFVSTTTLSQDYYSPQSIGYLLSLIIFTIAFCQRGRPRRISRLDWTVVILLSTAMAVTHQLTPFVTAGILVVLTLFGFVRSRWIPVVVIAPAGLWTLTNISEVLQHFRVGDIGNLSANLRTTDSLRHYHYNAYIHLSVGGEILAVGSVAILGLIALLIRHDRLSLALAACAASTGSILLIVHYGSEDIFRATLFALPWAALLAAYGASPQIADKASSGKGDESRSMIQRRSRFRLYPMMLLAGVPLVAASCLLHDIADYIWVLRPGDLAAELYFENNAPAGSALALITNVSPPSAPIESTARYPLFVYMSLAAGRLPLSSSGEVNASTLTAYAKDESRFLRTADTRKNSPPAFYVLVYQEGAAQEDAYGVATLWQYRSFSQNLVDSASWKVVDKTETATLFRFVPN